LDETLGAPSDLGTVELGGFILAIETQRNRLANQLAQITRELEALKVNKYSTKDSLEQSVKLGSTGLVIRGRIEALELVKRALEADQPVILAALFAFTD
jgi:hypothetical protein